MSLELNARQRAMLAEMGVKVWLPEGVAAVVSKVNSPVGLPAAPPSSPHSSPPPGRPPVQRTAPRALAQTAAAGIRAAPAGWLALQESVAHCRACALCDSRKNTVFGVGESGATPAVAPRVDWLIVGEAPGEHEDAQAEPFVGAAGKLLDNMLKAVGLDRHHKVFITNVLKCRPPANRNPLPDEIARCAPYLHQQIAQLQPRIILALGRFAVQTLLADSVPDVQTLPLGKLRGQIYAYRGVPVVVSYHPAYLLRNLPDKAKAWADLCLALGVVRASSPPLE
jgi:uracil-DNA glycosylase